MHTCGIALATTSMHMKCMRYKINRAHKCMAGEKISVENEVKPEQKRM